MKIFKYELRPKTVQTLQIPAEAKILSAHAHDNGGVFVWVLLDPYEETIARKIAVIGTGHEHNFVDHYFIDSVHHTVSGMHLVWHIFEVLD